MRVKLNVNKLLLLRASEVSVGDGRCDGGDLDCRGMHRNWRRLGAEYEGAKEEHRAQRDACCETSSSCHDGPAVDVR